MIKCLEYVALSNYGDDILPQSTAIGELIEILQLEPLGVNLRDCFLSLSHILKRGPLPLRVALLLHHNWEKVDAKVICRDELVCFEFARLVKVFAKFACGNESFPDSLSPFTEYVNGSNTFLVGFTFTTLFFFWSQGSRVTPQG